MAACITFSDTTLTGTTTIFDKLIAISITCTNHNDR